MKLSLRAIPALMSTMEEAGHVTKSVDTTSLDVFLWDLILSKLVRVRVVSVSYLRRVSLGYDADTVKARHVAKMCPWTGSPNIFILSIPTQPHKPLTNVNTSMCFFVPPGAQKTVLTSSFFCLHPGAQTLC